MSVWAITGSIILAVAGYLLLSGFLTTYRKYRGLRIITCPENREFASVKVDALRAAHWAAVSGEPTLNLRDCSRWPEKAGCNQECLSQVSAAPESCLAQTMVAEWYAGRACVYCQREIGPVVWHDRPPALRAPNGSSVEWKDVVPEQLPVVFKTHEPVCFACHIVESFRSEHPEMVVERKRPEETEPELQPSAATY